MTLVTEIQFFPVPLTGIDRFALKAQCVNGSKVSEPHFIPTEPNNSTLLGMRKFVWQNFRQLFPGMCPSHSETMGNGFRIILH